MPIVDTTMDSPVDGGDETKKSKFAFLGEKMKNLGSGKLSQMSKFFLLFVSVIGIISAALIFMQLVSGSPGFELTVNVENLGILAGVCALISGFYVLGASMKKE